MGTEKLIEEIPKQKDLKSKANPPKMAFGRWVTQEEKNEEKKKVSKSKPISKKVTMSDYPSSSNFPASDMN